MLTRNSRRALSEKINNEGSPAKKCKVDQASKKSTVKEEISKPLENNRNIKTSLNVKSCNLGPSTSRGKMLPRNSRRALSEIINNEGSPAKKRKVDQAANKATVKEEISKQLEDKRNIKTSLNVESCNLGPSTSKANSSTLKNVDVKKESLSLNEINADIGEADSKENNANIVDAKSINKEEVESDTDDIVELDISRHVLEVVLSSDDEDENKKLETINYKKSFLRTPADNSHPSGSSGNTSQTRATTSSENKTGTIKIEESSPQSTLKRKSKNLVLDPIILTPPTGDLWKDSEKLYKCMKFLEQSDLNPEAKEFVPSPKGKVPYKAANKPKEAECVVCLEPRETTFVNIPCRHAVTCGPCSDQLELRGNECPVCRTPIQTRFQIFN